jgi:ADP-heptose:LPS heptosyltransferase
MDSGMLWMAHAASCPVLVLLGPTREEERVSLHPLYPEKAKSISIAEMIGCQACFETQKFCKRNISCMKDFNEDQLLETIKSKLIEIVGE